MLFTAVFFFAIGITFSAAASGSSSQYNIIEKHERRQATSAPLLTAPLPGVSTSTSSFNWWPYPPASTSPIQPTALLPEPEETDSSDADADSLTITTFPTSSTSTSSSENLDSGSLPSTTSLQDSLSSSSLLITVTALPPLTSPVLHPHAISAYHQPINPLIFIPLFIILGSGVGLICGWYGYGFWKQWQQVQCEKRLAGPRYEGIKNEDLDEDKIFYKEKDFCEQPNDEHLEQPHLYKVANHTYGEADVVDRPVALRTESAWSRIGSSVLHRSPLLSGLLSSYAKLGPENNKVMKGDEQLADNVRSPNAPTIFSSVASSDEDDEVYEDARRSAYRGNVVRHKSMRRRLAEKLQIQYSPGHGFVRQKSRKSSKRRGKTPELEEGILLQDDSLMEDSPVATEKHSLKRNKTRQSNSTPGHGRAISDFSIPVEDIQTPPKVYQLKDPGVTPASANALQGARTYSTPLKSGNHSDFDDKYTPLPSRKVKSGRKLVSARSRRRQTEIMDELDTPPKFNIPANVDRRVLPTSPPLLTSPELESALFFSSSVDSANHGLDVQRSTPHERTKYQGPLAGSPGRSTPVRRGGPLGPRQSNKLLSKHSSSNGMSALGVCAHPFEKAMPPTPLRRSTARSSSSSPTKESYSSQVAIQRRQQPSALHSAPVPMLPKERHEARQTALDRVDAIVERSWSARILQGAAPPSSPTMFGAHTERTCGDRDVNA